MSPAPKPLGVGDLVGGTYKLERVLGRGSMGTVYEAAHVWLDRRFAVKVVNSEGITAADSIERFHREARITSGLHHPNIVEVTDFNLTPEGIPYLVMELLRGESLLARIKREGQMELPVAIALFRQMVSGLAAAHAKHVIHRDLKPQNIFICADRRGQDVVKLLDFGLSKLLGSGSRLTQTGTVMGSVPYIAPEQLRAQPVDQRADLHSLGAIFFEMLSGRRPYVGSTVGELINKVINVGPPSLRQLVPEIPAAVDRAVRRAMAKDPSKRWPDVTEFWQAFCDASGIEMLHTEQDQSQAASAGSHSSSSQLRDVRTVVDDGPSVGPGAAAANPRNVPTRALQPDSTPPVTANHSSGPASTVQRLTSQDLIPVSAETDGGSGSPSANSGLSQSQGIVSSETAMAETAWFEGITGPVQPDEPEWTLTRDERTPWRFVLMVGLVVAVLGGGLVAFLVVRGLSAGTASADSADATIAAHDSVIGDQAPTAATDQAATPDASAVHTSAPAPPAVPRRPVTPDASVAAAAVSRRPVSKASPRGSVKPRVQRGTLQITVFADQELLPSTIYLDGKRVGMTPLYLRNVPAGRHRLEARAKGHRTRKRTVMVKARRRNSFVITLEKRR